MKTPYSKLSILDKWHWKDIAHRQRMPKKDWRLLLLNNDDTIIFEGRLYHLRAKNIGYGVVQVFKDLKRGSQ